MSAPRYLVVWHPPKHKLRATERIVMRHVVEGTLEELAEAAIESALTCDLADEAGVYVGRIDGFGSVTWGLR